MTALLWLRRDLRRTDLPALNAAAENGRVGVVFVLDQRLWDGAGDARRTWLARTLLATRSAYNDRLVLRIGDPEREIPRLAEELGADAVHVSAETTPYGRRRDRRVADALEQAGVDWVETGSPYAVTPGRVLNGSGKPYRVFTPFSRAWQEHGWRRPADDVTGLHFLAADSDGWDRVEQAAGADSSDAGPAMPEAGRGRRGPALADVPRRPSRRLPRRAQPSRPGHHHPPVAVPQAAASCIPAPCCRPWPGAGAAAPTPCAASWPGASSTPTSCSTTPPARGPI